MDKLDAMISEALSEEDERFLKKMQMEEQGYFQLAMSVFGGRLGWVSWVIFIVQLLIFAVGVYATIQFFTVSDLVEVIRWGLVALYLMIVAVMMKLTLLPIMQTNRILRALRRMELRLSQD